jgi:hypothetical protein
VGEGRSPTLSELHSIWQTRMEKLRAKEAPLVAMARLIWLTEAVPAST